VNEEEGSTVYSDLDLAIYHTVHDYRAPDGTRGPRALAPRLGVKPGTLSNKADPACDTHHLNVSEAAAVMLASGDCRILHSLAHLVHHIAIPLGDFSRVADLEVLNAYTELHREIGETAAAINEALRDGKITRPEYEMVRRELYEDARAGFELLTRLEALIDE
jgi:hypothetical protein